MAHYDDGIMPMTVRFGSSGGPMTSTQVVGRVRRVFDAQKVGHGGTLDPMASGLLPIALGEATKTVSYVMDAEKTYRFTVRWGQATDSDDAEGAVTEEHPHRPDEGEIRAVLPDFTGRVSQAPPAFSAVKVAGRRAYDLARAKAPVGSGSCAGGPEKRGKSRGTTQGV